MEIRRFPGLFALVAAVVFTATFNAHPARACGGTFCDGGPQARPVDQTGENILFVMHGDGTVSAHVQIQYTGDPMRFAWVVPLPAAPDVAIGSQPLFDSLLATTVPRYGVSRTGCSRPLGAEGGGSAGDEVSDVSVGPIVLSSQVVGSFEVTVLSGGTAEELIQWLSDNDYEDIPDAPELFEHYVEAGMVFAAIKLVAGAGLDSIHPIEFRYSGDRPAIPIILTRVAAVEDMAVRVFVLAEERYVPTNYQHVTLNPVRLDWQQFAINYNELLSFAVDSEGADGHAFVTEYAGASSVANAANLYQATWDAEPFVTADPIGTVNLLTSYGLLTCGGAACTAAHPQVLPLLREHVPVPEGVDENAFYDCLSCYPAEVAAIPFDGAAFARDFLERLVVPGRKAREQLLAHPYLTRMLTMLSPEEMTIDPMFHPDPSAPNVAPLRNATWQLACSAEAGAFTVDEWDVALTEDATWPEFDEDMPYTLHVESFFEDGESDAFIDNTDAITAWLDDWNESRGWPLEPDPVDDEDPLIFSGEMDPSLMETPMDPGASGDTTAENDSKSPDAGDTTSGSTGDNAERPAERRGGGCRMVAAPERRGWAWTLPGLLMLGLSLLRQRGRQGSHERSNV